MLRPIRVLFLLSHVLPFDGSALLRSGCSKPLPRGSACCGKADHEGPTLSSDSPLTPHNRPTLMAWIRRRPVPIPFHFSPKLGISSRASSSTPLGAPRFSPTLDVEAGSPAQIPVYRYAHQPSNCALERVVGARRPGIGGHARSWSQRTQHNYNGGRNHAGPPRVPMFRRCLNQSEIDQTPPPNLAERYPAGGAMTP